MRGALLLALLLLGCGSEGGPKEYPLDPPARTSARAPEPPRRELVHPADQLPISPETEARIQALFPSQRASLARERLLEELGPPYITSTLLAQRVRFAVLKLSEGNLGGLDEAIDLARTDWRDALVAADFGPDGHLAWHP